MGPSLLNKVTVNISRAGLIREEKFPAVKLKWIILIVSFNEDVRSVNQRLAAFRCVKFCDRSHPENGKRFVIWHLLSEVDAE